MKPAIIVPAYSRPDALNRLLGSLNEAEYPSDDIKLIISLDGGASKPVQNVAESFEFKSGEIELITREENLGLRKHILWCGDQTEKHGAVIILEDDLYVDKYFYVYSQKALSFYEGEDKIAGIGLYSYSYNEHAKLPFEPLNNGYTGFLMQAACSSGQAWTKEQWKSFKDWYSKSNKLTVDNCSNLPKRAKKWPESSWKKYFSAYLSITDKYFLYPYQSYVTNRSCDGGVHVTNSKLHQVPLSSANRPEDNFNFCSLENSSVYYDPFMESASEEMLNEVGLDKSELTIDLNGTKPLNLIAKKKYVLTSRQCKNPIRIFKLAFHPIERCVYEALNNSQAVEIDDSELIYLADSGNVIETKQPYYKLADYYSYFPLLKMYSKKSYIVRLTNIVFNKIAELR